MRPALLILLSVAIAAPRVLGVTHEAYQATAHLWVGGLCGAWLASERPLPWPEGKLHPIYPATYAWLVVALSVVEVVCFLWSRS